MQVDLLYFPAASPWGMQWSLGSTRALLDTPAETAPVIDAWLQRTDAEYALFWDMRLGKPDPRCVMEAAVLPGQVWHAGLRLGMQGLPKMIDFVNPTWMLNYDPDPKIVCTSWRVTPQVCLVRTDVLRQLGGIDPQYDSLDGAFLDMGHRFIMRGTIMRNVPMLLPCTANEEAAAPQLSVYDELRFIDQQYGRRWVFWALFRSILTGHSPRPLLKAYRRLGRESVNPLPAPYDHGDWRLERFDPAEWHDKITVLIPTLERYPYLRNELEQLRDQTVRPLEIVITDQTSRQERYLGVTTEFPDLPLRVIPQDSLGQCTAWNAALAASRGEYILFLGDDADRIAPDFLERFVHTFQMFGADMVASLVDEVGAGPPPYNCTFLRVSDIFPITMIKRELLRQAGLMDFAFDRAKRADADLGMRCFANGALMILNPDIRLLHHRAPRGGLRKHRVRVVTYASSKRSVTQRNLPSVSEIYLALRHFTTDQTREELWLRTCGTFTVRGGPVRKILKMLLGLFYLPNTVWQIRQRRQQAVEMLKAFPQIPSLPDAKLECLII